MIAGSRRARTGTFMVVAGLAATLLVAGCASLLARGPDLALPLGGGSIASSQYMIDDNITISYYTAPGFTWSEPVTFNFTVDSNVTGIITVTTNCSVLQPLIYNWNVVVGLNSHPITLEVNPLGLPGNYIANITFDHLGNVTTITHEIWVGTNMIISYSILFGTLGFCIAIYAVVGAPKKPKASSSGSSGAAASASDDDTSTVTYVDQSQAPPGRIYYPECKKVIEEGSIFCPECGTRIPRYLRYHP